MKNESNAHVTTVESGESGTLITCESTIESEERWLPVVGFEGKYEVSDMGRVRSLTKYSRVLRPLDNGTGYKQASLVDFDGKAHKRYVHWAVLSAFVGPRPEGCYACHGNGNRADNRLVNLRWDTIENNLKDKHAHGTAVVGEQHMWTTKFNIKFAKEAKRMLKAGFAQTEIALSLGVCQSHISAIACGKTWAHIEVEDFYTKPEFDLS